MTDDKKRNIKNIEAEIFGDDPEEWGQLLDPDKDGKNGIAVKNGKPFPKSDYEMDRWEWDRILRVNNVYTLKEFTQWREKLAQQFRDRESGWFKQLVGLVWFKFILPKSKEYLTPKKLAWILTHLDQLLPWMPNETCQKILMFLDKAADVVYEKLK